MPFEPPIHRLPTETLLEIFQFCMAAGGEIMTLDFEPGELRCFGGASILLHLCEICQRWRDTALSSPTLWRTIDLNDSGRAEKCIIRSQLCSLYGHFHKPSDTLFGVISRHIHRWQHLSVGMNNSQEILVRVDTTADLLQSVAIGGSISSTGFQWLNSIFEHAPHLRTLSLSQVEGGYDLLNIPWSHLTRLQISGWLRESAVYDILSSGTQLRDCSIDGIIDDNEDGHAQLLVPFSNAQLERLSLSAMIDLSEFFDSFSAPHLREFFLRTRPDEEGMMTPWPHPQMLSLFSRLTELRTLTLIDTFIEEVELIDILQACSSTLTWIRIVTPSGAPACIGDTLLQFLTIVEGSPILCPKLTWIHFNGGMQFREGLLADMAASRCKQRHSDSDTLKGISQLEWMTADNPYGGTPEDLQRLEEMEDNEDMHFCEARKWLQNSFRSLRSDTYVVEEGIDPSAFLDLIKSKAGDMPADDAVDWITIETGLTL
jgi:hypothetical protein